MPTLEEIYRELEELSGWEYDSLTNTITKKIIGEIEEFRNKEELKEMSDLVLENGGEVIIKKGIIIFRLDVKDSKIFAIAKRINKIEDGREDKDNS